MKALGIFDDSLAALLIDKIRKVVADVNPGDIERILDLAAEIADLTGLLQQLQFIIAISFPLGVKASCPHVPVLRLRARLAHHSPPLGGAYQLGRIA